MTQPNTDQATIDNVTDALNTALPTLQSLVTQPAVAALNVDGLIAAAQAIVNLTSSPANATDQAV
jgi:hypothetical protein